MLCVREHVDWLDAFHLIMLTEELQVSSLRGWVAADVDDALRVGKENDIDDIAVHSGTRRVGDDDVGLTVTLDEISIEDVLHVTSEELSVLDAIYLGIHFGILDGLRHVLNANDFSCTVCHEVSDGAGARIEVVNKCLAREPSKLARYLI